MNMKNHDLLVEGIRMGPVRYITVCLCCVAMSLGGCGSEKHDVEGADEDTVTASDLEQLLDDLESSLVPRGSPEKRKTAFGRAMALGQAGREFDDSVRSVLPRIRKLLKRRTETQ